MLLNADFSRSFTGCLLLRFIFVRVSEYAALFIILRQFLKINSLFSFMTTEAWKENFLCEEIDP